MKADWSEIRHSSEVDNFSGLNSSTSNFKILANVENSETIRGIFHEYPPFSIALLPKM